MFVKRDQGAKSLADIVSKGNMLRLLFIKLSLIELFYIVELSHGTWNPLKIIEKEKKKNFLSTVQCSVMQSDGNSFCGIVVLDSFNMVYSDGDSI